MINKCPLCGKECTTQTEIDACYKKCCDTLFVIMSCKKANWDEAKEQLLNKVCPICNKQHETCAGFADCFDTCNAKLQDYMLENSGVELQDAILAIS